MGDENGLIGRFVAAAGGLLVAVSVFLTWYSLSLGDLVSAAASQLPGQPAAVPISPADDLSVTWSGWHGVHEIRFVLLLVGLAVLFGSLAHRPAAGSGRALFMLAGGLLAAVLAAYRIESPPGRLEISAGPFQLQSPAGTEALLSRLLHVHAGPWIALLGAALVTLGAGLQFAAARTLSAGSTLQQPTGRPGKDAWQSLSW